MPIAGDLFVLARRADVRADLETRGLSVTPEQKLVLDKIQLDYEQELLQLFKRSDPAQSAVKVGLEAAIERATDSTYTTFTPEQRIRLGEIWLQVTDVADILGDSTVQREIGLGPVQIDTISKTLRRYEQAKAKTRSSMSKGELGRRQLEEISKETLELRDRDLMAILTSDQLKKLRVLSGEPFDGASPK